MGNKPVYPKHFTNCYATGMYIINVEDKATKVIVK